MKRLLRHALASALLAAFAVGSLQAMPAFARKYGLSCKTCHAPFPKLKPYGDEFAANGFVIKDKPTPRYNIDTGDSLLSLLRDVPIAFRLEGFLNYNSEGSRTFDFSAPHLLKIISGGELFKNVSYYFYFFFSEKGEIAGIEDAFVMFNNLFGSDLDLYVGQFQVADPLFKREIRLPYEDYYVYGARPGFSTIDLTYDRGLMLTYGFATGTDVTLEVVNGNGIGEGNIFDNFDQDKFKNVMLRVSQDIVPALRVGAFGYLGKEQPQVDENPFGLASSVTIYGADATLSAAPFELNLQYLERRDANPFFETPLPLTKIATRGGFAELIFRPRGDDGRWYGAGLFNWVDSGDPGIRYTAATAHAGYLLRRNMRLIAEATYIFRGLAADTVRLDTGLVLAF